MASYFSEYADYLSIVGAISVCYVALKVGRQVCRVAWRTIRRSFSVDFKQYGHWAVVTGCTDGIGKSYALQLAEKGMDIVLISRNPQKLASVVEEIVHQHQVAVKVITADFKRTDIYENIKHELGGLDIGVLVNNVGMANPRIAEYFCDCEDFEQFNRDIINVNVLSCVMMTGMVLPDMLERKRGVIVNISSAAGLRPTPFCTIYSATKAFVRFFSEALNMEYSSQGITVQVVSPNMVQSNMIRVLSGAIGITGGLFFPSSDEYVRKALNTVGRESSTMAHWPHEVQQAFVDMIPDSLLPTVALQMRNKVAASLKTE